MNDNKSSLIEERWHSIYIDSPNVSYDQFSTTKSGSTILYKRSIIISLTLLSIKMLTNHTNRSHKITHSEQQRKNLNPMIIFSSTAWTHRPTMEFSTMLCSSGLSMLKV